MSLHHSTGASRPQWKHAHVLIQTQNTCALLLRISAVLVRHCLMLSDGIARPLSESNQLHAFDLSSCMKSDHECIQAKTSSIAL